MSTLLVMCRVFCFSTISLHIVTSSIPSNEYIYSFNRDMLMEAERKFEKRNEPFSSAEETVNHYLQYLKWRDFKATAQTGFPPSRPIEERLDFIRSSEVYKSLVKFPKGGTMHSHENHDVSRKILLDIVWDSSDFQYVYMLPPDHPTTPWLMDFFVNPPVSEPAWIKLQGNNQYSKEEILKHQTLIGTLSSNASKYPTDSKLRWSDMNQLWGRASDLISNLKIKIPYIWAMYEKGLEEGVIYFETRKNLYENIYVLDPSPEYANTSGRRFLDPNGDVEIEMIMELATNFSRLHPEFVGHRRISTTGRSTETGSKTRFNFYLDNVIRLRQKYPDHVVGFDAVGEEDAGYAHIYYLPEFLKSYSETGELRIPLYLHTAETNWPDDLMASNLLENARVSLYDLAPTLMNTYEAVLLSSKRVGHGYGFIKHPYLLTLLKEKQLPLEICVVSNQLLGFTPDIRNHPAQHYYRYGIPIVMGADDSGTFGYDNFTVDWYEAFMGWGLDLEDLKTIALNSFQYSALSDAEKQVAIEEKWQPMWNRYLAEMHGEACTRDYTDEAKKENRTILFARILPTEGAKSGTTKVHILGRNFEVGICQNVVCKFGNRKSSSAVYISNQHILCESPDFGDKEQRTVEVSVSFGYDVFVSTGFNFTYKYDPILGSITSPTTTKSNSAEGVTCVSQLLVRLFSLLAFVHFLNFF